MGRPHVTIPARSPTRSSDSCGRGMGGSSSWSFWSSCLSSPLFALSWKWWSGRAQRFGGLQIRDIDDAVGLEVW
jgi:hypothetical protein